MGKFFNYLFLVIIISFLSLILAFDLSYDPLKDTNFQKNILGLNIADNPAAVVFSGSFLELTQKESFEGQFNSKMIQISLPFIKGIQTVFAARMDSLAGLTHTGENNSDEFYALESYINQKISAKITFGNSFFDERLHLGTSIKYYSFTLEDSQASGFGLDLGGIYEINNNLFLGYTMNDLNTTKIGWNTGHIDKFFSTTNMIAGYKTDNLSLTYVQNSREEANLCLRGTPYNNLNIQADIPLNNPGDVSLSGYLDMGIMEVGYRFCNKEITNEHQLSLGFKI